MALIQYQHICNGCGASAGTQHGGCDVARCAVHGVQFIQCDLGDRDGGEPCQPNIWTGYWAGELEAVEYGFFARWKPEGGWAVCGPEHPDARPDLNRIMVECSWDSSAQRFVLRS